MISHRSFCYANENAHKENTGVAILASLLKSADDLANFNPEDIIHHRSEQGVAMLSGILNSDKAIAMNIAIMRTFVAIKKTVINSDGLKEQLKQIKDRLGEHDVQLNQIYAAMENLLDENVAQRKWDERQRIGFNK